MTNIYFAFFINFQLSLTGPTMVEEDLAQKKSDQEVLAFRVGPLSISKYIYDRERRKVLGNNAKEPVEAELKGWIKAWINRLQIVNKAIERGYGDHPKVKETTKIIADYTLINGEESPFARHILNSKIDVSSNNSVEISPSERRQKQEQALFELQNKLANQISVEINNEIADAVLPRIEQILANSGKVEAHDGSAKILYRYSINGKSHEFSLGDFETAYNDKIRKKMPRDINGLAQEILAMVIDQELLNIAKSANLHLDSRYVEERIKFKYDVIYNIYTERHFDPELDLSEVVLRDFYKANLTDFIGVKKISLWEGNYVSRSSAQKAKRELIHMKINSKNFEEFAKKIQLNPDRFGLINRIVDRNTTGLSPRVFPTCFRAPEGWIFPVIMDNDSKKLFIKRENLEVGYIPFEFVRDSVEREIRSRKRTERNNRELIEIGHKYQISFGDYIGEDIRPTF